MPRKKEPLKLLEAKGKSHMTKADKEARAQGEVKPRKPKQVRPPDWLPTDLRKEFNAYARQLLELDIFAKLDRDTLARYLVARQVYLRALNHLEAAISAGDSAEAVKWSAVQDKYFKQARNCANDLGLTVTSRCRMVVPQKEDPEADDPFLKLLERRRNA